LHINCSLPFGGVSSERLMFYFPSLHREFRSEPAGIMPLKRDPSHLDWLAAQDRLVARQTENKEEQLVEDVDLSDFLELEDDKFEEIEHGDFALLDED
jgi:Protein of unknown function (DUF3134)